MYAIADENGKVILEEIVLGDPCIMLFEHEGEAQDWCFWNNKLAKPFCLIQREAWVPAKVHDNFVVFVFDERTPIHVGQREMLTKLCKAVNLYYSRGGRGGVPWIKHTIVTINGWDMELSMSGTTMGLAFDGHIDFVRNQRGVKLFKRKDYPDPDALVRQAVDWFMIDTWKHLNSSSPVAETSPTTTS